MVQVSAGKETLKKMHRISKPWAEGLFSSTFCQFLGEIFACGATLGKKANLQAEITVQKN